MDFSYVCGIASILNFGGAPVAVHDLRRMCSAIAHRGPDDAGFALLNQGAVGLGHVRLSIMGLDNGHQPLFNEDGSIGVVCNGEIYDYEQHKRALRQRGHQFCSESDSELIVHLYEQFDLEFIDRINGEFAFVLWDERKKRLIASRDRAGVKPLYYHQNGPELLICSEIKGIAALDRVDRKFSLDYLTGPALGTYRNDLSPLAGIRPLKPGHFLLAGGRQTVVEREYYRPRYTTNHKMRFGEAVEGVRERLVTAVRRRMVADVPVHAYLSGGIDSTIICGLMAQAGADFTAFHVGFPGSPYDETEKARSICNYYGQRFETIPCSYEQIAQNVARTIYHTEMPLANYNATAKLVLSQFVRSQGVKVCLTGEGADEVFAGYPYFKLEALWRMMNAGGQEAQRAAVLWRRFRKLEARSEGYLWDSSRQWRKSSYATGYPSYFFARSRHVGRILKTAFQTDRLGMTRNHRPDAAFRCSFREETVRQMHPLNATRLITLNQLSELVIPTLGDRVEMANSLECRTPFLDPSLLDFSETIPPQFFIDIDRLREKYVLCEAFKDMLPRVFERQHKHPFLAPTWRNIAATRCGHQLFEQFLSTEQVQRVGVFQPRFVKLARKIWRWAPLRRAAARQLDALIGIMMSVHVLHHVLIENRPKSDPNFTLTDRSPSKNRASPGSSAHLANSISP